MKPIKTRISYGGALISDAEKRAINKVIDSQGGRRWTLGAESEAFEKELAEATGVKHAVVTNSGSSALLLAISALKLPKGSKVIIPALNFPTAYSSLLQNNLVPIVVDCDLTTLNLSFDGVKQALNEHPDTLAIVVVHIAGNIVDIPALRKITGQRTIISDNCDGYGGTLNGKFIDTYADISCISMHAAHIITMGEGGAVLTNNRVLANTARKMREWGRASGSDKLTKHTGFPKDYRERYVFEEMGYNLKPLELQCAMGRIQLKKLGKFKKARQKNYERLLKIFLPYTINYSDEFQLVYGDEGNCWFGFPFLCLEVDRQPFMAYLESLNIETRTIFSGNILRHPAYKGTGIQVGDLSNANFVMENGMFISNHPSLTDEQFAFIKKALEEYFK